MWEQLESGRVVHRFEPLVLVATLALIPVLILETEAKSDFWQDFAFAANWAIWAVFVAELAFILVVATRKGAALRAHWLDGLVVVVTPPLFNKFLASLRLIRLARLLRLLRLGAILGRVLQREREFSSAQVFRFVALLTLFIVVIAGAAESTVDSKEFPSFWRGVWWAVVTVTTVGYGDFAPRTTPGRIVAVVVMLFGIGFLSVLTATIASRFVQTDTSAEEMVSALRRIEADLAELKRQVAGTQR